MTKEEKLIIKVLGQLQKDVKQLKECVGYNGCSRIASDLTGVEMSLNQAMTKMNR